jgi:hypothetical protein
VGLDGEVPVIQGLRDADQAAAAARAADVLEAEARSAGAAEDVGGFELAEADAGRARLLTLERSGVEQCRGHRVGVSFDGRIIAGSADAGAVIVMG